MRILTGLQPSGQLHLGNFAGAIRPLLELQAVPTNEIFLFAATFHALTSVDDPKALRSNTRQVVTDYLAFGVDPQRCHIYLQQDLPEVTELAWILSCICPKHLMDKGVAFKDKVDKGLAANIGLFTYPILQAADILIVDADVVPVGRDQIQNVEICRDLAGIFNHRFGEVFKIPAVQVRENTAVVPGIDGEKMSKSYGNTIDPFQAEAALRKTVMRIKTDSAPVEAAKDPGQCVVFRIYSALAGPESDSARTRALAERYRRGGMGYGEAKQALFELILEVFGPARTRRAALLSDPAPVDAALAAGAAAARQTAQALLQRVRQAVGLR